MVLLLLLLLVLLWQCKDDVVVTFGALVKVFLVVSVVVDFGVAVVAMLEVIILACSPSPLTYLLLNILPA